MGAHSEISAKVIKNTINAPEIVELAVGCGHRLVLCSKGSGEFGGWLP